MGCPQCQRQNGPGAKFCDECGCVLPWLWPRAAIGSDRVGRPRHKPPPARRREIAAAIGVVATGLGVISGVVIASPGWQRIIAAWRESSAARAVITPPTGATATEQATPPSAMGVVGGGLVADPLGLQRGAIASPGIASRLAPPSAPPPSAPVTPRRGQDSTRPADRTPSGAQADAAQVMASLLITQLGQDPAWRTALANADAHAPDSPEHAYWRNVATAIRDGGYRSRP